MHRDVVAQGPSKSRCMKNIYCFIFPRAMLMLRQTARETGSFPEQANCYGVIIMSQRKGDKGCLYHHTRSPRQTPSRRRSVGGPGAPSPRLMVIPRWRERNCSHQHSHRAGREKWGMQARTKKLTQTIYEPHAERRRCGR